MRWGKLIGYAATAITVLGAVALIATRIEHANSTTTHNAQLISNMDFRNDRDHDELFAKISAIKSATDKNTTILELIALDRGVMPPGYSFADRPGLDIPREDFDGEPSSRP